MRNIDRLMQEYSESHQNPTNKKIHNIAVPAIYFVTVALLYCIPVLPIMEKYDFTFAHVAIIPVLFYYFKLSGPVGAAMTALSILVFWGIKWLEYMDVSVWQFSLILFVVMWILQFIGHAIEGKKPSFFKDVQFLLIGPVWVISGFLKKLNIQY
ncbi:DUF962 domain-containing protein [Neptunicella marina]|uniref:DUF962 domain-containing protein n=1 Tax=Neptunicella marina TaxID=2125989 RepID=A0A8J6INX5_9ALTE|nr:Mpo1-like protein [Neptunicella marina]MBC3764596.1 DUF962 domain-containing protein [Neptunicella marina]